MTMRARGPSAVAPILSGCAAALLLLTSCQPQQESPTPELHGTPVWEETRAADFILTDQHERDFRLSDQKGRVVLLFFGYTTCPDVCPATLSTWARVRAMLGKDASRVTFAFVTVDPERDTPEVLKRHVAIFDADILGLTGTTEQLAAVYEAYDVYREKVVLSSSAAGYIVDHTMSMFLIDRDGDLRARLAFDAPAEHVAEDIAGLSRR